MTKIVGTTTTGIIFSDASPKKPGESIAEYTERLIDEAEELCRLKTPAEIKQDKRNQINRIVRELHELDEEYFKKRKELENKACELERQILKGE